jgi:hypothetical protein
VELIHGLWGDPSNWNSFTGVTTDSRFWVTPVNYNLPVFITASQPSDYSASTLYTATSSSLGFATNGTPVWQQIAADIYNFRMVNNAAAAQADVVAHSMGGTVARTIVKSARYPSTESFQQGNLHKLITIGTPHLGSPLAGQLLNGNDCVRMALAKNGSISFSQATLSGNVTASGGVGDLQGDGWGGGLSPALQNIQTGSGPRVPTAPIAGIMGSYNLSSLGSPSLTYWFLHDWCGGTLGSALTPSGWPTIFGQDSDAIVPLKSQLAGLTGTGGPFSGVVHSAGTEKLGFTGPDELSEFLIQNQVLYFLNLSLTSTSFTPLY